MAAVTKSLTIAIESETSSFVPNLKLPLDYESSKILETFNEKKVSSNFYRIAIKLHSNVIIGTNARCIAILEALKAVIQVDYLFFKIKPEVFRNRKSKILWIPNF